MGIWHVMTQRAELNGFSIEWNIYCFAVKYNKEFVSEKNSVSPKRSVVR
jgi:hypothetical protein